MLGDTFLLNDQNIVFGKQSASTYYQKSDRGASLIIFELLTHYQLTRFSCHYVFCVLFVNSQNIIPEGGGCPINGGINQGGGFVHVSSMSLKQNEHFQCTLQHELGHSFGLPHVNAYGYDMSNNPSIMSYNPAHYTKGFEPSLMSGIFIPEDRRALALNKRVFAKFKYIPEKQLAPMIYFSPIKLND